MLRDRARHAHSARLQWANDEDVREVHGQFQCVVLEPRLATALNTLVNTVNTPTKYRGKAVALRAFTLTGNLWPSDDDSVPLPHAAASGRRC
jgi:hypothetical protein